MNDTPPPSQATADPATTTPARAPAGRGDKIRLFLILGGMVAILAIVLWAVRDNVSAGDLAVGTCFDVPGRDSDISTVTRHDCTAEHDAEVFHVADYTGSTYPISLSLERFIDESCLPAFATYVGEDYNTNEDLTIGYFYPSRSGWDDGDRTVSCYAARLDSAKLNQSVKAAGG